MRSIHAQTGQCCLLVRCNGFFLFVRLLGFHIYHFLSCSFAEKIISKEFPLMTDGNLNSCEVISNSEPLRRKFIDVVLEKNCPSQDPVNLTIKFRNEQNCGIGREELVLYSKTERRCHENCRSCNAILTRCIATDNQSSANSCSLSCTCTGSHCQFVLALKPLIHAEVCDISIKH